MVVGRELHNSVRINAADFNGNSEFAFSSSTILLTFFG